MGRRVKGKSLLADSEMTRCRRVVALSKSRVWPSGQAAAFQAAYSGSNPEARSNLPSRSIEAISPPCAIPTSNLGARRSTAGHRALNAGIKVRILAGAPYQFDCYAPNHRCE